MKVLSDAAEKSRSGGASGFVMQPRKAGLREAKVLKRSSLGAPKSPAIRRFYT